MKRELEWPEIILALLLCAVTFYFTADYYKKEVKQTKINTLISISNDPDTSSPNIDGAIGCRLIKLNYYSSPYLLRECLKNTVEEMFSDNGIILIGEEELKASELLSAKVSQNAKGKKAATEILKEFDLANAVCIAAKESQENFTEALYPALTTVKYFIGEKEFRDKINAKTDGTTPLHCAAAEGNAKLTDYLLVLGADTKAKNKEGETPLESAKHWKEKETAKILAGK
jgi:hypothetical protein